MMARRRRDHRSRRRRDHHRSKHWYRAVSALREGSTTSRRATTDLEREQRVRARRRVRERGRHDARVGSRAMRRLMTEASSFGFVRVGFLLSSVRSRSVATCPKTGHISRSPARTRPHDAAPPRVVVVVVAMAAAEERDIDELELLTKLNSTNPADRIEARRQVRARRRVVVESHPIPSNSVAPSSSRARPLTRPLPPSLRPARRYVSASPLASAPSARKSSA